MTDQQSSEELIASDIHEGVLWLKLNRPEVHNAQNHSMLEEFQRALDDVGSDGSVRVVVLAGNGPSFSSGHDLRVDGDGALRRPKEAEERWFYENRWFFNQAIQLRELAVPTIAAVNGNCLAAGLVLALMCDFVIASNDAVFGDPVGRMAAIGPEVLILPWAVGERRAKQMMFTGTPVDAVTAERWGLVNEVVDLPQLHTRTQSVAQSIAQLPSFTVRMLKRSINRVADFSGMRNHLNAHFDTHVLGHMTEEAKAWLEGSERRVMSVKEFVALRDAEANHEGGRA